MHWPLHRLEDLTKPDRPITYGVVKPGPEDPDNGVKFIRGGDIFEGRLAIDSLRTITPDVSKSYSRTLLSGGELVVSLVGNPGHVAVVPKSLAGANLARQAGLVALRNEIDADFVKFFLMSPQGRAELFAQMTGSVQVVINLHNLRTVRVPLPPLPVQRRIAGILSAYDELMENSQRRIRLLEAMARALYREWFVHFRFPGHEKHPRVASPLGDIPQGWECIPLSNLINVTHGYAFQGAHFSEEPTSLVLTTPGNFQIGGGIKYDKLKFYQEGAPLESAYVFEPMDLMLTMTDLSKAGDTLGYPAFVPRLTGLTFLHNQRVGKVVPLGDFFPKHFLHCLFCDERYRHHIVGGATGTSVKHTSPSRILSFQAAMPKDRKLIRTFDEFAKPVFEQIGTLIQALQNLRRTRDLLLPRLLSGQVSLLTNTAAKYA